MDMLKKFADYTLTGIKNRGYLRVWEKYDFAVQRYYDVC